MKKYVKYIIALVVLGSVAFYMGRQHQEQRLKPNDAPTIVSKGQITGEAITDLEIAESLTVEEGQSLADYIPEFVDVPPGGIPWDIFANTASEEYKETDSDGVELYGIRPIFTDEIRKIDGQDILMQGYMFPLDAEEEQSKFLFGPFPVGCPYHYHAGPEYIIEVYAEKPIKFSWEAINLTGRLELVPDDREFNVFYRLHDAKVQNH